MQIRLEGRKDEMAAAVDEIRQLFSVQKVSRFYPNQTRIAEPVYGRVYITLASNKQA